MEEVPGYHIIEILTKGHSSVLCRAVHLETDTTWLLKMPASSARVEDPVYQRECEILLSFNHEFFLHFEPVETQTKGTVFKTEDQDFVCMSDCEQYSEASFEVFFETAIILADLLGELHQHRIIFRQLCPDKVLVSRETGKLYLADFSLATRFNEKLGDKGYRDLQEHMVPYMSPEQTGRMNREVDYRSDFYSLGVLLYEMITGILPFRADDLGGWIHAHLARRPESLKNQNTYVPSPVSGIIDKLLAKHPEERYQSAYGLKADVWFYRQQNRDENSEDFILGRFDRTIMMDIPSAFIGRNEELKVLRNIFCQVKDCTRGIVCVTGASGVGKTELIRHFMEADKEDGTRVLYGKNELLKPNVPYLPLIQAVQMFLEQLFAEPEDILVVWKEKMAEALGENRGILTNLIPEIEMLLGPSPEIPDLPPTETEIRLNLVFQNFFDVLTKSSRPLRMIFDDLQWADRITLKWVEELSLLAMERQRQVSIIAIYRDGEISDIHPLRKMFERVKEVQGDMPILMVKPFTLQETSLWLATALGEEDGSHRRLQTLAKQFYDKTGGSPLFLRHLLTDVYEKGQIYFQHHTGSWQWNLSQIRTFFVSDDVAGLTLEKFEKMPLEMKHLLHAAACIGFQFRYGLLSSVCADIQDPLPFLQRAVVEGIITRQADTDRGKETYTFLHDQIWLAAYSLRSGDTTSRCHYLIGKHLLEEELNRDGTLFTGVNHLNKGIVFLEEQRESIFAAEMNLSAAKKARMSVLYDASLDYAESGLKWLEQRTEQPIVWELLKEKAQALYLHGDVNEAEVLLTELLEYSDDIDARMSIYSLRINLYHRNREEERVQEIGIQALRELGIRIPSHTPKARVLAKYFSLRNRINKKVSEGKRKPSGGSRVQPFLWEMRFAEQLSQVTYTTDPNLWAFMSLKMLEIAMKREQEDDFPNLLMTYGLFVIAGFSDVDTGYRCGRWASELNGADNYAKGYVEFVYGSFVHTWKHHPKTAIPYLQKAAHKNMAEGRQMIASAAMNMEVLMRIDSGMHLAEVLRKIEEYRDLAVKLKFHLFIDFIQLIRDNVLYLYEPDRAEQIPPKPLAESIDSGVFEEELRTIMFSVSRLQTLYWLGRYDMLCTEAKTVEPLLNMKFKFLSTVDFHFYYAMGMLQSDAEDIKWKDIKRQRKHLKFFAEKMPHYSAHLYDLVLAEMNKVRGNSGRALVLYDRALEVADENDFPNIVALAAERKGTLYQSLGQLHAATRYFTLAHRKAEVCGIYAKSAPVNRQHTRRELDEPYRVESGKDVDLTSLMKSSIALSKEMKLERLVTKLLGIAIENAGAMKGSLILVEDDNFFLVAEAREGEDAEKVQPLTYIPLAQKSQAPHTIIHYTARTKKPLVVDNSARDEWFREDPYITKYRPKSVLSLPIITRNKIIGILYLENSLTEGVFGPARVKMMELFSDKVAISIVNARLYTEMEKLNSHLEEKVKERTRHLEQSQVETASALAEKSILEERQHIAKEVHDVVGHSMTTAMVQMEAAKKLMSHDTDQAENKILLAQDLLRRGMKSIRQSVEMLSENIGTYAFVPELKNMIHETQANADVQIESSIEDIPDLSAGQKRLLVQILREGLTNGIRHGRSRRFHFTLQTAGESVIFRLQDDGIGFEKIEYGFGLRSMQKRIADFNGDFRMTSPGSGCLLEVTLPKSL